MGRRKQPPKPIDPLDEEVDLDIPEGEIGVRVNNNRKLRTGTEMLEQLEQIQKRNQKS